MKQLLYQFCIDFAEKRNGQIIRQIREVNEALISETKSSAGDKHETGRAMLQLEREKLGQQLLQSEHLNSVLQRINTAADYKKASLGSFVETDKNKYYIAISAGKFQNTDQPVFCISADTPIAKQLMGKSVGETIIFNDTPEQILKIS